MLVVELQSTESGLALGMEASMSSKGRNSVFPAGWLKKKTKEKGSTRYSRRWPVPAYWLLELLRRFTLNNSCFCFLCFIRYLISFPNRSCASSTRIEFYVARLVYFAWFIFERKWHAIIFFLHRAKSPSFNKFVYSKGRDNYGSRD